MCLTIQFRPLTSLCYRDFDFYAVEFKVAAIDKLKEFPSLKYIRFINGTFMDYFGPPPNPPQMNVISLIIDPENAKAAIPGDGSATILITHTTDVARFVAAALSLPDWPEKLLIRGDRLTLNEVVAVAESVKGSTNPNNRILYTAKCLLIRLSNRHQIRRYLLLGRGPQGGQEHGASFKYPSLCIPSQGYDRWYYADCQHWHGDWFVGH